MDADHPDADTEGLATTTAQLSITSLPGTDDLGWTAYPSARCDSGNQPAVMARTTQSVLVVCQIQRGNFCYRGVRLSDGASIELADVVRSSGGFDVTNPTDETRYRIRPDESYHHAARWTGLFRAHAPVRIQLGNLAAYCP